MAEASSDRPRLKRGFASISPERRREIATMGGKGVPAESRAFSKHKELASEAGRKGGLASGRKRKRDRL
jgi:general stress protein YciG